MPCTHVESCFSLFRSASSLWRFVAQSRVPVLLGNRNNICDTGTNSRWMAGSTDQQLNFASAFNCLQKLFIAWCTPPRQHYLLNKHVVPGWQGRGAYHGSRNKYGRTLSCIWALLAVPMAGAPWISFSEACTTRGGDWFLKQLGCGHLAAEVTPSFRWLSLKMRSSVYDYPAHWNAFDYETVMPWGPTLCQGSTAEPKGQNIEKQVLGKGCSHLVYEKGESFV